jgi:glucokinase
MAGFLPYVNRLLEKAGSPRRYRNLFGITLGTGFGGGIVRDGKLFTGDNSMAGEIWSMRHKLEPNRSAEEGVSIRAVRRVYADQAGLAFDAAPDPREIADIAEGKADGNRAAAIESYRRFGEITGDALANALTLIDGLTVIGGGLSQAHRLFLPALMAELNADYQEPGGELVRRLTPIAFNLEDSAGLDQFLAGDRREITVPRSGRKLVYDPLQRIGVGLSRLGTSEATALGAYAFALQKLDETL